MFISIFVPCVWDPTKVQPVGGVIVAPVPPSVLMQAKRISFAMQPAGVLSVSELAGVLAVLADVDERNVVDAMVYLYSMKPVSAVAGAVLPVGVVVAAKLIAVLKAMPFAHSTFAAAAAGIGITSVGAVVPSVTEPLATLKTCIYATELFGL